jgi:hypothetical protein
MRKREKKLQLHCETLHRLSVKDLANAQGALGPQTSCVGANCCAETVTVDTQ